MRIRRDHSPRHRVRALRRVRPEARPRPRRPAAESPPRRRPAWRRRHRRAPSRAPSRSARRTAAAPVPEQLRRPRRSTASFRAMSRERTQTGREPTPRWRRRSQPAAPDQRHDVAEREIRASFACPSRRRAGRAPHYEDQSEGREGRASRSHSASAGNRGASTRWAGTRTSVEPASSAGAPPSRRPTARAARSSSQASPNAASGEGDLQGETDDECRLQHHSDRKGAVVGEPLEQLLATEHERGHQPEMPCPQTPRARSPDLTRLGHKREPDDDGAEGERQRQIRHVAVARLGEQMRSIVRVRRHDPVVDRVRDLRADYCERDGDEPGCESASHRPASCHLESPARPAIWPGRDRSRSARYRLGAQLPTIAHYDTTDRAANDQPEQRRASDQGGVRHETSLSHWLHARSVERGTLLSGKGSRALAADVDRVLEAIREVAGGSVALEAGRIDRERSCPAENMKALAEVGGLRLVVDPRWRDFASRVASFPRWRHSPVFLAGVEPGHPKA